MMLNSFEIILLIMMQNSHPSALLNNLNGHYPVLYSFRRCPYAMRARLAIAASGIKVELREILLKNKPQAMLEISPKATVPVMQLTNGAVIDESIEVALWALQQNDPLELISAGDNNRQLELIATNDFEFKPKLDQYKYAVRFPQKSIQSYRQESEFFLQNLNDRLSIHAFLMGEQLSLADLAIFPFIRQFAAVDRPWFESSPYVALVSWLKQRVESSLFIQIMQKYKPWVAVKTPLIVF
ncbi:MAG: glutathione S-transferase [Enterobacterales bacterium]|nr:glutathione S-transferase [Enterobacterales bacterium]